MANGCPLYVVASRSRGTYHPIDPYNIPSSNPAGRCVFTVSRTDAIAARRSTGNVARYSATVFAVLMAIATENTAPPERAIEKRFRTANRAAASFASEVDLLS